jgi:uncharacterized protein YggE
MKVALAAAAMAIILYSPVFAQDSNANTVFRPTTLNLSASGETQAAPDMASIVLGVNTQAATAAEALRLNAAKMTAILAGLRRLGLGERDIQTTAISLNAQYVYGQDQPPRLTGYQASNEASVTVRDLAELGPAIDASSAAGANQINGIRFGLKDPQAAEDQARRAAIKALAAKADLYAQATGYRIVRLMSLTEGGGYQPGPPQPVFAMAKAAAPTPVEAGELTVRIDVSAVYELGK